MRNITKIFILVFSLILLLAVSCSNDDKTGIKNNPPEDMEITDGETGSGGTGSSSGDSSETGTGGETGGSGGSSGTETGGETGTGGGSSSGGSSEAGTGSEGGSEEGGSEGGGGETEITEPLEEKDFPPDLLGDYTHSTSGCNDIQVFINDDKKKLQMNIMFIRDTDGYKQSHVVRIEKCTKTTKGGKIIKVEEEHGGYIITFDYEAKTISGTYISAGEKWSFSGTKK